MGTLEATNALHSGVVKVDSTKVGLGFDKPVEGSVPLPWVGYNRVRAILVLVGLGQGETFTFADTDINELKALLDAIGSGGATFEAGTTITVNKAGE